MTEQISCLYQLISKFNMSQEGVQKHLNKSQKISQSSLSKSVLHFRCAPAPLLLDSVAG